MTRHLGSAQTHVTTPVARPLPRKHAGTLLAHDMVKRAAVGASRPQPGSQRSPPQHASAGGDRATAAEASQQAGAELLTWLNNAVPATGRTASSPAGKGGAAAVGQPAAAVPASEPAPLRRPVSDSHLWVRARPRETWKPIKSTPWQTHLKQCLISISYQS